MTVEGTAEAPAPAHEYGLAPEFVRAVMDALDIGDAAAVRKLVDELQPPDVADLLELVRPDARTALVQILGRTLDPDVLPELGAEVRDQVLDELPPETLAAAVQELDSDDAIYLLEDLSKERQDEILQHVADEDRAAVELGLRSEEGTAGRLMQREFLSVPAYWTVGQTIDYLRETPDLPDQFYEIFVVDAGLHPIGTVPLARIMRSRRPVMIGDIMEADPHLVPIDMDQEEIAYLFDQYNLVSAAVVDADNRIVGMLTVDDVVDVIAEEAEEDLFALSGVKDEALTDNVISTARRRFSWLFINLFTALVAATVIGFFQGTIVKFVALAVLMPIVASIGGNAGIQTLTVAVRALATRELTPTNAVRIVVKQVFVGGILGVLLALLIAAVAGIWFQNPMLSLVIGVAMIVNLLAAGLVGILVPLTLHRMGADPAVSSSVFVTATTDILGFFVFLGLATWVLAA